jgi:glycolate oxidase iron-sulfur subunit
MKTEFTPQQLADPTTATSEKAIRTCVHCGFCTATCPTYVLLGDERDGPRGRIWLIKDMLEKNATPTPEVVTHIDRCLSCLACETTCPSGVSYRRLVDHARSYIEDRHKRPLIERVLRFGLAKTMPDRDRFAAALSLGRFASPLAGVFKALGAKRIAAALRLAANNPAHSPQIDASPATAARKGRVLLQAGCAEPVLRPQYQAATARLLNRLGYDVVRAPADQCCGSLTHHMGREHDALASVRQTIDAWTPEIEQGVDAIIFTVTGCGTTLKDYGFLMRNDPAYAARAARISALAKDITEFVPPSSITPGATNLRVAYHPACSLQHGQKITTQPKALLQAAGFTVVTPANAHLCCGSAGTYNILQPEIADQLGDGKTASLEALKPDVIATGNVGCSVQIAARTGTPVVHVAELLDWATGGPKPAALKPSSKTGT